jgi:hypothetical protein
LRREDLEWIRVPPEKFEHYRGGGITPRDNPDGRHHVCMPPPNHSQAGQVFCASLAWLH